MERKYSFEAGLNVFTSYKTIIPVEDFSILKKNRSASLSYLWNTII